MKHDEKDEFQNIIENLYNKSYNSIDKISKSIEKFHYYQYKNLELELIEHINNEPLKIFKNKYKSWIKQKKQIEKELNEIIKKIIEESKS